MTNLPHFRAHMEQTHETLHEVARVYGQSKKLSARAKREAFRILAKSDRACQAAAEAFNRARTLNRSEAAE